MRVLARITPGPTWMPGRTVWEQGPAIAAHLRFMEAQYADGALLVGGPLRDGRSGMALLDVADLDVARALAAADPAVQAQAMTYEVAEVLTYFDAFGAARMTGASHAPPRPQLGQ